jgi:hypothetical protein
MHKWRPFKEGLIEFRVAAFIFLWSENQIEQMDGMHEED